MATGWLHKLQESDRSAKKMYLVAGTILAMTVIVSIWLTWFNPVDLRSGLTDDSALANVSGQGDGGFSLWQSVQAGLQSLGGVIMRPREYIVKPPQN